jgi:hypothetical protein
MAIAPAPEGVANAIMGSLGSITSYFLAKIGKRKVRSPGNTIPKFRMENLIHLQTLKGIA